MRRWSGSAAMAAVAMSAAVLSWSSPVAASDREHEHEQEAEIAMLDDCNPASFNKAIGPGACVGDGRTTFPAFIAELQATKVAKAWRFAPPMLRVMGGRPVMLQNEGGETHTFTLVKAFGGGFVAPLNLLSGNPVPAPECATTLPSGKLVPKPPSPVNVFVNADRERAFRTAGLAPGKYLFQCCIHPWMRVILTVR